MTNPLGHERPGRAGEGNQIQDLGEQKQVLYQLHNTGPGGLLMTSINEHTEAGYLGMELDRPTQRSYMGKA